MTLFRSGRNLFVAIAMAMAPIATLWGAPTYVLQNARCLGSNQVLVGLPDHERLVTACAPRAHAELVMQTGYQPGEAFNYRQSSTPPPAVATFFASDGFFVFEENLTETANVCFQCWLRGTLPVDFGPTDVFVNWWEPWFLRTTSDGQWMLGVEDGGIQAGTDDCADRRCYPHYYSWGTYDGWRIIETPEPGTLMLLGLGLVGLGMSRRRQTD